LPRLRPAPRVRHQAPGIPVAPAEEIFATVALSAPGLLANSRPSPLPSWEEHGIDADFDGTDGCGLSTAAVAHVVVPHHRGRATGEPKGIAEPLFGACDAMEM